MDVWHQTLTSLQLLENAPQLILNQLLLLACLLACLEPAVSCASWMVRTLLFSVASGTKLLGVSSSHDVGWLQSCRWVPGL